MPYLSLARKYRPQTFDEIMGQEHIAITLKNAIALKRVAHAYLFCGPRGVGKTSTARILAKSLNCEKGPSHLPCGKCASCTEISEGRGMDVVEIDGASNRGIDEIRNLKESIKFASIRGKFRIYIIDEVHMLTQEAFNALLKTLEEPPAHVKFIFATTQPYKVLPTVISRCQRFDFRKITSQDICKKLENIRKKEKLNLADEAIFLITKASDGSMRDAEVILDQLLAFTKGKVEGKDVTKVLGLLEQDTLFEIANCLAASERARIFAIVDNFINNGKDPLFVAINIIDHFRNLLVVKTAKGDSRGYTALSEEDFYRLEEQGRKFSLDEILYVIYTLSGTIDLIKKTSLGRIPLEVSLIKLTERTHLTSIKDIVERLAAVERSLGVGSSDGAAPAGYPPQEEYAKTSPAGPDKITVSKNAPAMAKKEEVSAEKDILLFQKIKDSWARVLNFVKNRKMSLATFLSEGQPLKIKDNVLDIGFTSDNFLHRETLETEANRKFVEEAIKSITGERISLKIESMETLPGKTEEGNTIDENPVEELAPSSVVNRNKIEPIVESAMDIFGGKIIDIRNNKEKGKK